MKIVIPSAPGSTTDTLARLVADQLSHKWGKPAIIENIAGGAMNIGASTVARATLVATTPVNGVARSKYSKRITVKRSGTYRTRLVPADGDHVTGYSARRRERTHR